MSVLYRPKIIFLVEASVLAIAGLVFVLYAYFEISTRSFLIFYRDRVFSGLAWYSMGQILALLVLRLSYLRLKRGDWKDTLLHFKENYLALPRLILDLRLVHSICLMFVLFLQLKHLIPYINERLFDQAFLENERWMLNGRLAGEYLIEFFSPDSAIFFSKCYVMFYPYMGFLLVLMLIQRNIFLAAEFCLAFVWLWFLGILLVYLIPTWGPCFFQPELFKILPHTAVLDLQKGLWTNKLFLAEHPNSTRGIFGISGFPSLHLAVITLGSLYLRKVSFWAAIASWIFMVLTVVSTLYFGWHYLADDFGGILLAWMVVFFVRKVAIKDARNDCHL